MATAILNTPHFSDLKLQLDISILGIKAEKTNNSNCTSYTYTGRHQALITLIIRNWSPASLHFIQGE